MREKSRHRTGRIGGQAVSQALKQLLSGETRWLKGLRSQRYKPVNPDPTDWLVVGKYMGSDGPAGPHLEDTMSNTGACPGGGGHR